MENAGDTEGAEEHIGAHWLRDLEMRDEIETMAQDLSTWFHQPDFEPTPDDFVRYPPN